MGRRSQVAALSAAAAVTAVLFIDLCGVVFGCGCESLWRDAALACNIHNPTGPHCPWCAHPFTAGATAFMGTVAVQAGLIVGPMPFGILTRFALALPAVPGVAGILGLLQGVWYGYW
jgi:hypothetical protein